MYLKISKTRLCSAESLSTWSADSSCQSVSASSPQTPTYRPVTKRVHCGWRVQASQAPCCGYLKQQYKNVWIRNVYLEYTYTLQLSNTISLTDLLLYRYLSTWILVNVRQPDNLWVKCRFLAEWKMLGQLRRICNKQKQNHPAQKLHQPVANNGTNEVISSWKKNVKLNLMFNL